MQKLLVACVFAFVAALVHRALAGERCIVRQA